MKDDETFGYECNVILVGALMMTLIEWVTGHVFFWMLWVISFVLVVMGYIDHVCIGWKLTSGNQFRRILTDIGIALGSLAFLYLMLWWLLPSSDMTSISQILRGVQRLLRVHQYFGFAIYTLAYYMVYIASLGMFRILYNIGTGIYISFTGIPQPTD